MSQKIKNAQKFLSNLGRKSIKIRKNRSKSHKNFLELSNGIKEVSNYNRLIQHSEEIENYKELYLLAKEELSEVKKNEENRLRMIREDLKAFEEKRREIISERERRHHARTFLQLPKQYCEDEKFNYINQVIIHLKLLLVMSPEDVWIINRADESLESAEASQRMGMGIKPPYRYQFLDLSTDMPTLRDSEPVTREEFIYALKNGLAYNTDLPTPEDIKDMKRNLLDKTIPFVGVRC